MLIVLQSQEIIISISFKHFTQDPLNLRLREQLDVTQLMHHCNRHCCWWNHGNCSPATTWNVWIQAKLVSTNGSPTLFVLRGNWMIWSRFPCSTSKCRSILCTAGTMMHHCRCRVWRFVCRLVLVRHRQRRRILDPCANARFWWRTNATSPDKWNTVDLNRPIYGSMRCIRRRGDEHRR